jgi:hypothetical protein
MAEKAALPRRDPEARARLRAVDEVARPVVLARERALVVPGELGTLLPGGTLRRGLTATVGGSLGSGVTSLALTLAAAATATGEWAAAVDLGGTLNGEAARSAGVALERFAVLRGVEPARWAVSVAALLDGVTLVMAELPRHVSHADARRLVARTRERGAVLVVVSTTARWPADAGLRLVADSGRWHGLLDDGNGLLEHRDLAVRVDGQGVAARARDGVLVA